MSSHKNNLFPLEGEPPNELVEHALDGLMRMQLESFASSLETARSMWRRFREMVEAPEFPEHLRSAFMTGTGQEPDDECAFDGEEALEPGFRESLLPDAVEVASNWVHNGVHPVLRLSPERAAQHDAKFLSDLGIVG